MWILLCIPAEVRFFRSTTCLHRAWALPIDSATIRLIRGGYGISYLPPDLTGELASTSLVNAASTQINVTGALPTPLEDLYPKTLNQPIGRTDPGFMTLYCCTASLQNISGPVPQQNFPYVQQWNLTVSHEFKGDWMAEIGYSGLKGSESARNRPCPGRALQQVLLDGIGAIEPYDLEWDFDDRRPKPEALSVLQ